MQQLQTLSMELMDFPVPRRDSEALSCSPLLSIARSQPCTAALGRYSGTLCCLLCPPENNYDSADCKVQAGRCVMGSHSYPIEAMHLVLVLLTIPASHILLDSLSYAALQVLLSGGPFLAQGTLHWESEPGDWHLM